VRLWVSKRLKIDSSLKNLTWMSFVFFIVLQFKLNLNCNKKICGMLVILERSRILNHRATRESVGTYNYVPDALQIYYILIIFKKM
jgi:hypothetical protein